MKTFSLITLLFIIAIIPISCTNSGVQEKLRQAETCIDSGRYAKADSIFETIDDASITDDADKALVYLLRNRNRYLTDQKASTEELQRCIDYYSANDEARLCQSYYYMGVAESDNQNYRKAVEWLKKAEHIALGSDDLTMLNKIYENLTTLNNREREYAHSLHYAKLCIDVAKRAGNNYWLAYAYDLMAINYQMLAKKDSAVYYMNRSMELLKYVPDTEQQTLIANYIIICSVGNDDALKLAERVYSLNPTHSVAYILASRLDYAGKSDEAEMYWKIALSVNRKDDLVGKYKNYIEVKGNIKDYKSAFEKTKELFKLEKELESVRQNDKISVLQTEFDRRLSEQRVVRYVSWLIALIVILGLMVVVMVLYIRYKYMNLRKELTEKHLQIKSLEEQLSAPTPNATDVEQTRRMLDELYSDKDVMDGKNLYERIMGGETTVKWAKKQYMCFLSYFWSEHPQQAIEMRTKYCRLTPRQEFYLAVAHLFSDRELQMKVMGLNEGSLRTMKARIRQQMSA